MGQQRTDAGVLADAGAYFLSVLEASQDCIRVISLAGRLEYMNARGRELFEIDDFEGRNRNQYWPDMWPPEGRPAVEDALNRALAGGSAAFRALCPTARGNIRWWDTTVSPVLDEAGRVVRVLAASRDVTAVMQAERHRQLLVNELNHRVKNTLAIVQSIAAQSLRNAGVDAAVRRAFEGRLMAIAATHNVLTDENWAAASLRQIVEGSVRPYLGGEHRATIAGPDLKVSPKTAVVMALAFHELAINALKYGALSLPGGAVEVGWALEPGGRIVITWSELGGPPVTPPTRRGFGSRIIELALASELDGEVALDYRPEGLVCTVRGPLAALDKADAFMTLPA